MTKRRDDRTGMSAIVRRVEYSSRSDVFTLWFLGDLHVGSAACDEALLRSDVRAIAENPLALWVGLGDLCEFIQRSDWRFRQSQLAPWVRGLDADYCDDIAEAEIARVVSILHPIRDKCLGIVAGNHEDRMLAAFERDVQREVAKRLGVDNLGYAAWLRLLFTWRDIRTSRALDIYVHHGWFSGRKDGQKVNNLHDLLLSWNVDIAAVGHGHARVVAPPLITYDVDGHGNLRAWKRYALMAGSYANAYAAQGSYAMRRGYRPQDLGAVRLYYEPDRPRLTAEL